MTNQNNIKIFGLGLGLLLAGGSLLHLWHYHLGALTTLLIFGSILFVIEKSLTWPWLYTLTYSAIFVATLFGWMKYIPSTEIMVSELFSIAFLLIALFKPAILIPFYNVWMKGAHLMGQVFTTIVLTAVYFLVFTPISFLLRLMGKDHMQRKLDSTKSTYWQKKEHDLFSRDNYHRQF